MFFIWTRTTLIGKRQSFKSYQQQAQALYGGVASVRVSVPFIRQNMLLFLWCLVALCCLAPSTFCWYHWCSGRSVIRTSFKRLNHDSERCFLRCCFLSNNFAKNETASFTQREGLLHDILEAKLRSYEVASGVKQRFFVISCDWAFVCICMQLLRRSFDVPKNFNNLKHHWIAATSLFSRSRSTTVVLTKCASSFHFEQIYLLIAHSVIPFVLW